MDLELTNKTAHVTGSTGRIGFAIASLFAQEGAAVVVTGRSQKRVAQISLARGLAEMTAGTSVTVNSVLAGLKTQSDPFSNHSSTSTSQQHE